jgi:hypothetical protein
MPSSNTPPVIYTIARLKLVDQSVFNRSVTVTEEFDDQDIYTIKVFIRKVVACDDCCVACRKESPFGITFQKMAEVNPVPNRGEAG